MRVVVVANGELPAGHELHIAHLLGNSELTIAADGGLRHCRTVGIWPHVLVGDLDSADADLVQQARDQGVEVRSHPSDKDATDLELALADAVSAGATEVTVVTPFGGRLDHELATIGLLASSRWKSVTIAATDGRRHLWVIWSSVHLSVSVGATVSLVPWAGDVTGVTTVGLQWPLTAESLQVGTTRGVSNVAVTAEQTVSIDAGTLLAITDS